MSLDNQDDRVEFKYKKGSLSLIKESIDDLRMEFVEIPLLMFFCFNEKIGKMVINFEGRDRI